MWIKKSIPPGTQMAYCPKGRKVLRREDERWRMRVLVRIQRSAAPMPKGRKLSRSRRSLWRARKWVLVKKAWTEAGREASASKLRSLTKVSMCG